VFTELAATQIGNAALFTGRRYDAETGLYYYRTRYLDSAAGRFITRDTIGIWGDPEELGNGYTYVANRPSSATDPSGSLIATAHGVIYGARLGCYCDGGSRFAHYGQCTGLVPFCSTFWLTTSDPAAHREPISLAIKEPGIKFAPSSSLGFFDVWTEVAALGANGSGSAGSTRSGLNTTRSNIKHQSMVVPGSSLGYFDVNLEFGVYGGGSSGGTRWEDADRFARMNRHSSSLGFFDIFTDDFAPGMRENHDTAKNSVNNVR